MKSMQTASFDVPVLGDTAYAEGALYEDGVGCPNGISKKAELKNREKNVTGICPLTETSAAGAKGQTPADTK